jgi:hypothetical protein
LLNATLRSRAGVYLHGANVTSWIISNGSDVLFVRPDTPLDGVKPIRCACAHQPHHACRATA